MEIVEGGERGQEVTLANAFQQALMTGQRRGEKG